MPFRKKEVCDVRKAVFLMMCVFFSTVLVACKQTEEDHGQENAPISTEATTVPEETTDFDSSLEYGLNAFDESLINYLCMNGYYDSDFVISPAGCRAMLCLAAAGAEGNTRTELMGAAGFSGTDEMQQWYDHYRNAAVLYFRDGGTNRITAPLYAMQSIWNDSAQTGDFTTTFQTTLNAYYNARAYVSDEDTLTEEIGSWLNQATDGMMTAMYKDVSGAADVLVSAVYLKTLWAGIFHKTDSTGDTPLMEQTGRLLYADESGTQIVVLPMQGNLSFVCFQGNRTDMFDKLAALQPDTVHVVLPEFEMDTVFDANDLLNFSISRGVQEALNGATANFSPMCQDSEWFLQELLQISKLSVTSTEGEAEEAFSSEEADVKEFTANDSFSFIIFYDFGTEWQQVLLYGQRLSAGE